MSTRILVVDDDPEVIRLIGQVLRSAAPPFDVEVSRLRRGRAR